MEKVPEKRQKWDQLVKNKELFCEAKGYQVQIFTLTHIDCGWVGSNGDIYE